MRRGSHEEAGAKKSLVLEGGLILYSLVFTTEGWVDARIVD